MTDDRAARSRPVPTSGPNIGDTDPRTASSTPARPGCSAVIAASSTPASTDPDGQNIVNTAEATGTDPDGHDGQRRRATDDVDAFNPAISLTKLRERR